MKLNWTPTKSNDIESVSLYRVSLTANENYAPSDIREFDRNMGPYPLDPPSYYERWQKLTSYIQPGLIKRILPNNGRVSHLPTNEPADNDLSTKDARKGRVIEKEEGMDFTPFDLRQSFPKGATGEEITRWSLDKSWLTKDLLHRIYHDGKYVQGVIRSILFDRFLIPSSV